MFKYSDNNKRYHTLDYFYKHKFGCKIAKISLNAGFTCPNKDGTKGVGGCIYCSKLGSGDYAGKPNKSLTEQFFDVKNIMDKKWPNTRYIGYFQANTNTYAPLQVLKEKYEEILKIDGVVGLNIATRSDAISDECLDYLEELNKRTYLNIELGLQTIHESTNKLINRGETLEEFERTIKKLRERELNIIIHIINGLPYESREDMLETVKYVNNLDIQGIKIHMLHIIKDTKLAELYEKEKFHVLSKEEYVDIVCDELELLREEIVIHRITGDPNPNELIEPKWLIKKFGVLNDIDKEMARRNAYQGDRVVGKNQ
jgi:radical SAM protein (TIGR01212 family)